MPDEGFSFLILGGKFFCHLTYVDFVFVAVGHNHGVQYLWVIVERTYVFSRRRDENDRSADAVETFIHILSNLITSENIPM